MKIHSLILFLIFSSCVPCFAEKIDPKAQFELGAKYEAGRGVKKDFAKALELYRSAAEAGYAPAQSTLGYFYLYGEGVKEDFQEAFRWNLKAAEAGDSWGQLNVGVQYDEGSGVPEDNVKANAWYQKAAEQGQARAQLNLGVNYWNGEGIEKDYVKAYNILNHVRMTAPEPALRWKARNVLDQLKKVMSEQQIKEAGVNLKSRFGY